MLHAGEGGEQIVVKVKGTEVTKVLEARDVPEAVVLEPKTTKTRVLL